MSQQWQSVDVLLDQDNSYLDKPITYDTQAPVVPDTHPIMQPSHYLNVGAELIAQGWIINAEARNKEGRGVVPESEEAVEWCTIGVMKAGVKYAPLEFRQYMIRYLESIFNAANAGLMLKYGYVWSNNDRLSPSNPEHHALIVRMFARARDYALAHPELNTWPDAPFDVTKIKSSERINDHE